MDPENIPMQVEELKSLLTHIRRTDRMVVIWWMSGKCVNAYREYITNANHQLGRIYTQFILDTGYDEELNSIVV